MGGDGTLFVGEDKEFALTLPGTDMSGWNILFDVRLTDKAPDPALLSKTATITGSYSSTPASNTQEAVVVVSDTEMNVFKQRNYRYSWKKMDDGTETVLRRGDFKPEKATAP